MSYRRRAMSAALAAGLAMLPLSTATAQSTPYPPPNSYPPPPPYAYPPCSPFPLAWPFCVVGAVVGLAASIVAAPFALAAGVPPPYLGYYGPPPYYRPPPPPYYPPAPPPAQGYTAPQGYAAPH
jgi:hypothetical protein